MSHNTLAEYYNLLFNLRHHHKWTFQEVEELIVFERDVYVEMLTIEMNRAAKMAQRIAGDPSIIDTKGFQG